METDPKRALSESAVNDAPGFPLTSEEIPQKAVESLVKVAKEVVTVSTRGKYLNPATIAFRYYNSFNYSLLPRKDDGVRLTFGITSANAGEGKSLAAANLAVSLAMGYQKKAVIVDLNIHRPTVHETFGTPLHPGLVDALSSGSVHVVPTKIPQLFVLPAGDGRGKRYGLDSGITPPSNGRIRRHHGIGLEQMAAFSDVINALEQEYEFVIVDMPAINSGEFPILFANRLGGLLVVVDTQRTKRDDLDRMFRRVNEHQVLGFIYNRVREDGA